MGCQWHEKFHSGIANYFRWKMRAAAVKSVYTLYEGKIIYNGMEYESEIDGYSGVIRGWEAEAVKR